jgi:glycosyltransferase involved in cell wall biosynthesis
MISVGVSPAAREMAAEAGAPEESLRCIPNGVDLTRFSPIPWTPGPPWRLLMVGRLTAQKGIDRLIRALEGIEEVELHLVGEGEEEGPLRGLARELRVPSVFHGWQANIAGYYADAHVLLLPSRWEGFGLVAVEAMASGRPVISSAVDGLDEVLGEVGIRVQGDEMDDLRKAIQQALGQPEDLRERGLAGPVQAARFGIRRTVMAYEKLYRELAASSIQP